MLLIELLQIPPMRSDTIYLYYMQYDRAIHVQISVQAVVLIVVLFAVQQIVAGASYLTRF